MARWPPLRISSATASAVLGLDHVVHDHVGARPAQRDRDGAANAGIAAGDQRGLALEQRERLHGRD